MRGLMQKWPLVVPSILDHAAREHGTQEIVTRAVEGGWRRYGYGELHRRALQVAGALRRSGIGRGDRIGTLAWNTDRHMEVWYGTMGIGAVCHTINPRLFPEQIEYIIEHAGDRLLFVDSTFAPLVEKLRTRPGCVEQVIVLDPQEAHDSARANHADYEEWLACAEPDARWADFPEETAAGLCYTSGTTGHPKGVLYSHRSNVLHALSMNHPDAFALRACDVVMPVVPMFHANAWAIIFMAPMAGSKLVLPGAGLDGASLWELLDRERVTVTAAVPTVWMGLLQYLEESGRGLPHLERVFIGGSAVPRMIVERFEGDYGVEVIHAWGMTEMSPVGTVCASVVGRDCDPEAAMERKLKQGRAPYSVSLKLVDDAGVELPRDGRARGHLMVKGPAVVERYFGTEQSACDSQGWFATGDVATLDGEGFMQIVDRSKDIIKSGGEWISSIELENVAIGHPEVVEAAVIGIAHAKWGERPLLVLVTKAGAKVHAQDAREFLRGKVARWWLPESIEFVTQIPRTATGKVDKRALREQFRDYRIPENTGYHGGMDDSREG